MGKVLLLKFFLLLSILLIQSISYSQSITWQRIYDGPRHSWDFGYDVCESGDGYFFVVGSTLGNSAASIWVLKLNAMGDTAWTNVIPSPLGITAHAVTASNDGGCVLTGSQDSSFTIKLNSGGVIVWQKFYGGISRACSDIIRTQDGHYVGCGEDFSGPLLEGYAVKVDSSGNLVWQRTYPSTYDKRFRGVTEAIDGGYILAGSVQEAQDTANGYMLKIDTSGSPVWEKRFRFNNKGTFGTTISRLNNGYLMGGVRYYGAYDTLMSYFVRTDINGNILFTKVFTEYPGAYLLDMKPAAPNRFIVSLEATETSTEDSTCQVLVTDSLGNTVIQKFFIQGIYPEFYAALPLGNGDIVFAGYTESAVTYLSDVYVARTDSMLNVPPIGIETIGTNVPTESRLLPNFPNPFNPVTYIRFEMSVRANITMKIYDINGREAEILYDGFVKAGEYRIKWDASNFSSGVYFAVLIAGSIKISRKMVLLK